MTDWIGTTFTSTIGWEHLESLVELGNRMAGSEGERYGLELTRDAFEEAGCSNARIEEFDVQGWVRGESSIVVDDRRYDPIALPRSPAGTVTGELVDLGYGLPDDFEQDLDGAIVMVSSDVPDDYDRFIHRREKYYYAVESGAAGFIFANHVEGCLPPTGSVGSADAPIGEIPAVGASKELGATLARQHEGSELSIEIDCETPEATSGNAIADLGPDTDEFVIVSSHVDAHDISQGAMDNGAGTATIVEMANALAERRDELDTRVRFVAYGAEEVGLVGSSHLADRIDRDRIKAIVNVDSNVFGRTLKLDHHGFDALEAAAETVADRFDHPIVTNGQLVPHSDHWPFVKWGVPGYMISGETGDRGRGWGHTHADTLEKLDVRNLREQAILLTELVVELTGDDVRPEPRTEASIAEQLEAEDLATGMKATGDWPY